MERLRTALVRACPQTRAKSHVHKVCTFPASAEVIFPQRIQIRIFLDPDRQTFPGPIRNLFIKLYLLPPQVDRVVDYAML